MLKPFRPLWSVVDLPTPLNINIWWNFGRCLGLMLLVQTSTGLLLSMQYTARVDLSFTSVAHIMRDVDRGWLLRIFHINGASFFMVCLFCHVNRGLYYGRYTKKGTWLTGVVMFCLVMAISFLGYVLPWGQMRYWGATVITNLFGALPYVGERLLLWVWGGFSVDNATLIRFYSLHFLLPLILAGISILHIILLHEYGSNNPIGLSTSAEKVPFHWYFTIKDILGFVVLFSFLISIAIFLPYYLGEPDNFEGANSLKTPTHIVPEWYFLFAYAILRAIPNKLGGVVALFSAILLLVLLSFVPLRNDTPHFECKTLGNKFYPKGKIRHWLFTLSFVMLTYLGAKPIDTPYYEARQFFTWTYFYYFYNHLPPVYQGLIKWGNRIYHIISFALVYIGDSWEPIFIFLRACFAEGCRYADADGSGVYFNFADWMEWN